MADENDQKLTPPLSIKDLAEAQERTERLLEQIADSLKALETAANPKPSKIADLWLVFGVLGWIATVYVSPGVHVFTNLCLLILTLSVLNLRNRWI